MSSLHVLFQLGDAEYALCADDVLHMESYEGATPVPGAPRHVAGLVQIRGRVVPVVDLRTRFGLPAVERRLENRVVVVESNSRLVGLLVDSAREVQRIEADQFRAPPEVVAQQAAGYIDAVAQVGQRLVMRIDIAKVIGDESLPSEPRSGPAPQTRESSHGH